MYSGAMKAELIYNPKAGPHDVGNELPPVLAYLDSEGWQVALRPTCGSGDATTYAREAAANGADVVVAIGGDGTLGEVADGLVGSQCAMGLLPAGMSNVWAHMLGLPVWSSVHGSALMDAARILVEGRTRPIDLGRANTHHFVLWCGVGFDAQVTYDVEPYLDIKRRLGKLSYAVAGVAESLMMRGTRVTVVVDGHAIRQRALLVLVANAQLYGSAWRVAPYAQLDDGVFDVYVFKGGSALDVFRHLFSILLGIHVCDPKVDAYRARRVEIVADAPMPLHTDGDPSGHTPVTIEVLPKALKVIVPPWASGELFEGDGLNPSYDPSLARRIAERLRQERERWRIESERLVDDLQRRLRPPEDGF